MDNVRLRPAQQEEAGVIRQLIHEVGINPTGLSWRRFIVATDPEGQLVGCGQLKPHGSKVVELASIAVAPAYRHQGIGRALIEQLLAQGPRPLYLMCRPELGTLYAKFGFQRLTIDGMPAYFRRIMKVFNAYQCITDSDAAVWVMKLQ